METTNKSPSHSMAIGNHSEDVLVSAAQAVVDQWDSPAWKDLPHTGEYIARLRSALAAYKPPEPAANPLGDVEQPEAVEPVAKVGDLCLDKLNPLVHGNGPWSGPYSLETDLYTLSPTATQALRMAADVCDEHIQQRGNRLRKLTAGEIKERIEALIPPISQGDSPVQSTFESEQHNDELPVKYYKEGGITYAVYGSSSIHYVEFLLERRKLGFAPTTYADKGNRDARLDFYSDATGTKQQRELDGSVEMGQPLGDGPNESRSDTDAQGMVELTYAQQAREMGFAEVGEVIEIQCAEDDYATEVRLHQKLPAGTKLFSGTPPTPMQAPSHSDSDTEAGHADLVTLTPAELQEKLMNVAVRVRWGSENIVNSVTRLPVKQTDDDLRAIVAQHAKAIGLPASVSTVGLTTSMPKESK